MNAPGLMPTWQLLAAFDNGPLDDVTQIVGVVDANTVALNRWTDITQFCTSVDRCHRGKQTELDKFEAGELDTTMWNVDGRFNSWNNGSPYYPNVIPMRPVQLRATWNQMQVREATFDVGTPTWQPGTNTTTSVMVGPAPFDSRYGTNVLSAALSTGTGTFSVAQDPTGSGVTPCVPGMFVSALCYVQASAVGLAATLTLTWLNGSSVISTVTSTPQTDAVGSWTQLSIPVARAPFGTTGVIMGVSWAGASASDFHFLDACQIVFQPGITAYLSPGPLAPTFGLPTGATNAWPVFTGYVDQWPSQWPDEMTSFTQMHAYDGFSVLALPTLSNQVYATDVASLATHYWRCNDAPASLTVADSVGGITGTVHNVGTTMQFGSTGPLLMGDDFCADLGTYNSAGGQDWIDVTGAGFTGNGTWSVELWFQTTQVNPYLVSQNWRNNSSWSLAIASSTGSVDFTMLSAGGAVGGTGSPTPVVTDGIWHHLVATWDGTTAQTFVDGALTSSGAAGAQGLSPSDVVVIGAGTPTPEAFGGLKLSEVAFYAGTALTGSQVAVHYAAAIGFLQSFAGAYLGTVLDDIGWPTAMRSLGVGTIPMQQNAQNVSQTAALSQMQLVETTDNGELFMSAAGLVTYIAGGTLASVTTPVVTFGDGGSSEIPFEKGSAPVLDTLDLWNIGQVTRTGGLLQTVTNPASIAEYGPRSYPITGTLHADDPDALSLASYIATKYGVPQSRLRTINVHPLVRGDGSGMAAILPNDLMTRVAVHRAGIAGADFLQPGFIQAIDHTIDMKTGDWRSVIGLDTKDASTLVPLPGSETFVYVGMLTQSFVVPAGVSSLTVDAWGGGVLGGAKGGRVQCTLAVSPSERLLLNVGGRGVAGTTSDPGPTVWVESGAGGGSASSITNGGSGGGGTDIRQGGSGLANRQIVVGGAGGTAGDGTLGGAGGGTTGAAGSNASGSGGGHGGHPGTPSSGGAGGSGSAAGSAGSNPAGGNGGTSTLAYGGAGGGGGYFGGGGGGGGATTPTNQTFSFTGAAQSFAVPAGVTAVTVDMYGAAGAGSPAALGGRVQCTLAVTPGETLQVNVGGNNGFNGGGGAAGANGGGGGGTDIRQGGTTLANVQIAAGGGGGSDGSITGGAGGGTTGAAGSNANSATGGGGGTPSAGGAGGTGAGGGINGNNGSLGLGGNGNLVSGGVHNGGGGGGYYGGGAGGEYKGSVNEWFPIAPYIPSSGVANPSVFVIPSTGVLYAAGGKLPATSTAERYNPTSNTWTSIANQPYSGQGIGIGIGSYGYVLGNNNLYRYDPSGNTWSTMTAPPTFNQAGGVFTIGGLLYAILLMGSGPPSMTVSLYSYDPTANAWTARTAPPAPITAGVAQAVGTSGYWAAGRNANTGVVVSTNYVYHSVADSWTTASALPAARFAAAGFVFGGQIYVVGGYDSSGNPLASAELYDPPSDTWSALPAVSSSPLFLNSLVAGAGAANATQGYIVGQNQSGSTLSGTSFEWPEYIDLGAGGGGGSSFTGSNCSAVTHTQGYSGASGNGQVNLSWTAPADGGGGGGGSSFTGSNCSAVTHTQGYSGASADGRVTISWT